MVDLHYYSGQEKTWRISIVAGHDGIQSVVTIQNHWCKTSWSQNERAEENKANDMSTRNNNHNHKDVVAFGINGGCSSSMSINNDSLGGRNCEENFEKDSQHNRNRQVRFSMSSISTRIFQSTSFDDDSDDNNDKEGDRQEDNEHCVEATSPQRLSTKDNNENDN